MAIDWTDGSGPVRPVSLAVAGAVALAGFGQAFGRGAAPGLPTLLLLFAGAVVAFVMLVRAELPPAVRGGAAAAILVALVCCAIRDDPFGAARRRDGRGTPVVGLAAGGGASGAGGSAEGGGGPTGATLSLEGGRAADDAETALSGHLAEDVPGAASWRVSGALDGSARGGRWLVSVEWRIVGAADEARCGTLAISATSQAELHAALRDAFAGAVRRSARSHRSAC